MTPDKTPPQVFRAEDFHGLPLPFMVPLDPDERAELARVANARLAQLTDALERLSQASDALMQVDDEDEVAGRGAVSDFMLRGRDVLAAWRALRRRGGE